MKNTLLDSAARLRQPRTDQTDAFRARAEQLAAMASQVFEQRADRGRLVGEENIAMAADNNRNFARFMTSLFLGYDPEALVETVLWVFRSYRAHGFNTTYWAANLNIWIDILRQELPPETYQAIYPFYDWLIINIPLFTKLTDGAAPAADGPSSLHG